MMMAEFNIADNITRSNEGGWQNDPDDRGNDSHGHGTYRGIASKIHPTWKGWPIVAAAIAQKTPQPLYGSKAYYVWVKGLNAVLAANAALQEMVVSFYRANFWEPLRLSEFKSQSVANKVYDSAVNQGVGTAAMILQKVLGIMPDGNIGPVTITAVNKRDGSELALKFREARMERYKRIVIARPDQEKYLSTWLSRC